MNRIQNPNGFTIAKNGFEFNDRCTLNDIDYYKHANIVIKKAREYKVILTINKLL